MQNALGKGWRVSLTLWFSLLYLFGYFIEISFPRGCIFTVLLVCVMLLDGLWAGSVPLFQASHVQGMALGTCPGGSWYPEKVMEMGRLLLGGYLMAWPWISAFSSLPG